MSQPESPDTTSDLDAPNGVHESGIHLAAPRTMEERSADAVSLDELARALAFDLDADDDGVTIVVEELEAFEFEGEAERDDARPQAEAPTPFAEYVQAVAQAASAEGGDGATLGRFLDTLELPPTLDEGARRALREADILSADDAATDAFRRTREAWRAILDGTSEDFAACGGAMLDEWTADLCARWLGTPALAPRLRRALRDRGVAAFGLTLVA